MSNVVSSEVHAEINQWSQSVIEGAQMKNSPPAMVPLPTGSMNMQKSPSPPPCRLLYDIPCKVCQDHSSGKHYGIYSCDGCAGFFKRSIRRSREYKCRSLRRGGCLIDKTHRNQCRACRLTKCIEAGMNKEAVQHERGPRNSTLRRQMSMLVKVPYDFQGEAHNITTIRQKNALAMYIPQTPEEIACEVAAKLLFMNMRWAKKIGAFITLPLSDKLLLLSESWKDLFIIGAVPLLSSLIVENQSDEAEAFCKIVDHIDNMNLDATEIACLRTIILFRSTNRAIVGLTNPYVVTSLQHHAYIWLNKYIQMAHPARIYRLRAIMMLVPTLSMFSTSIVEKLFFRKIIGNVSIERIISDMYMCILDEYIV